MCAWVECEGFVDVWDAEAVVEWDPRTGVDVCMVVRRDREWGVWRRRVPTMGEPNPRRWQSRRRETSGVG